MAFKLKMAIALILAIFVLTDREGHALESPKPSRQIVDMAGRTATVPLEVRSIGILGSTPILYSALEILGASHAIANRPNAFHDLDGRWRAHKIFAPNLASAPYFRNDNSELSLENILLAKPDLCLTMTPAYVETLEKLGVPCVFVNWATVSDMKRAIRLIAVLVGQPEKAERYLAYYDSQLAQATNATSSIAADKRRKTLYVFPRLFLVPENPTETLLKAAGANSVTRAASISGRVAYGLEEILAWNPEIIFMTTQRELKNFKNNSLFQNLTAIKNDQIVLVPTFAHFWSGHTVEAPLAVEWFIHKLYPELLSREALAAETRSFYRNFFGTTLNDGLIEMIIDGGWDSLRP
ncbi:MAG: ABC transporter substrate-binding protein [Deltaproteobacteria bacterium]|jgi:iron complex transport system substrate-binding protein|nr:ABC transporter substrate-binding protein [Deltaproteobacteria bacterium]